MNYWNNLNVPFVLSLLLSTRRQKTDVRKSREKDLSSDHGKMDIMLGKRNSNSIDRELDNAIKSPERHQDFEYLPIRGSSAQENEIRNSDNRTGPVRRDDLAGSIELFSSKMNARLSQELDSVMKQMQTHIKRTNSSSMNDRVILERQDIMGSR